MKIGILTYHWVYNMGANLQCLSTYRALEQLGHEPIVINYIPADNEKFQRKLVSSNQIKEHELFVSQMRTTDICQDARSIAEEVLKNSIEAVIIGSDAVFNLRKPRRSRSTLKLIYPLSDNVFPNPFIGEFKKWLPEGFPIAALSVSCQNTEASAFASQRKEIGNMLNNFCFISVRDNRTKEFVEYFSDHKLSPDVTPDPVFHFNQSVGTVKSKDEILKKYNLPNNYILISLDNIPFFNFTKKWNESLIKELKANGYFPVLFPKVIGGVSIDNIPPIQTPISPLDWYYLIKYSQGYIGCLMHPIVVCLHNNVPFYSFDSYGTPNMFGIRKKITSKTYHIVSRSENLQRYFHVNPFKRKPNPKIIINALKNYDYSIGSSFSQKQTKEFERNLLRIINSLSK